jgi:hypothetical protein
MVIAGYLSKLIATSAVALFFGVPFKESFTLGLMMNLRGLYEVTIFLKWLDEGVSSLCSHILLKM